MSWMSSGTTIQDCCSSDSFSALWKSSRTRSVIVRASERRRADTLLEGSHAADARPMDACEDAREDASDAL